MSRKIRRKSRRVNKLTPNVLRKMVMEEKRRLRETSDPIADGISDPADAEAEEVDADDQANTLEKDIDHIAVLKIQESILKRKYAKVQKAKKRLVKKISKKR